MSLNFFEKIRKTKGEKHTVIGCNVRTLLQNLNNSKNIKVTAYILIFMERGQKSNPQMCSCFSSNINSKNVI